MATSDEEHLALLRRLFHLPVRSIKLFFDISQFFVLQNHNLSGSKHDFALLSMTLDQT